MLLDWCPFSFSMVFASSERDVARYSQDTLLQKIIFPVSTSCPREANVQSPRRMLADGDHISETLLCRFADAQRLSTALEFHSTAQGSFLNLMA